MSKQQTTTAFEKFQMLRPHLEGNVLLSKIEEFHTISLSTLKRWLKNYKTHGWLDWNEKNDLIKEKENL